MECASVVIENQHKESQDEGEMLNSSSSDDDASESESDSASTHLDDVLCDVDDLPSNHKISYKIMSLPEIRQCQEQEIIKVSNNLSIQRTEAILLLAHCEWDVKFLTEKWDEDSRGFREELGLHEKIAGNEFETTMTCNKCSGTVPEYLNSFAFCGHEFCITCWRDFIRNSIREQSLLLRCPFESCNAAVNQDLITRVASKADQEIYSNIFLRSYLSDFTKGKWCPNEGCNHGVLLDSGNYISSFTCKCLLSFCFKCDKEAHRPVSCAAADKWLSDMRRACSQYWISQGNVLGNDSWLDGQYVHVDTDEILKEVSELENNWDNANMARIKFLKYLARWNSLHIEQHQLLAKLRRMQLGELKVLAEKQGLPLEEVSFVEDAWLQAAECKRVFKWANVYDYYNLAFEDNRRSLYYSLSVQGTFVLEELCQVACDLQQFIGTNPPTFQFKDFRDRLSFKSSVACHYFKSMMIAIHIGYPDMESLRREFLLSRQSIESKPVIDVETTSGQTSEFADETSKWTCPHCNLSNYGSTKICFMCYH